MNAKFMGVSNKMIGIIFFIVLVMLNESCNSATPTKATQTSDLALIELEGNEFFINQKKYSEISNCISANNEIKESIKNFHKDNSIGKAMNGQITRKVIQRGNLSKGIPKDQFKGNFKHQFLLCIDKAGAVSLANLQTSNPSLNDAELKQLMSVIFDYKYEEKINAKCLECGKLTVQKTD